MQPSDLTPQEVSALTRILQLLPTESPTAHASRIASAIPNLPSHLRRVGRLSSLIRTASTRTTSSTTTASSHGSGISSNTCLCKQHKALSTPLIRNVFTLLALEVGRRLNTLTLHAATLTPQERERITSLRELHSLWLPPQVYRQTFLSPPSTQWGYNPTQCPACTLSLIAGHMPTLLSLRMILLSRTSSRERHIHRNPRLTAFITAWIASLSTALDISSEDFETLISANDDDAFALKVKRKQIWDKRREAKRIFRARQDEQKKARRNQRATPVAHWDTVSKPLVTVLTGERQPGPPLQPQPENGHEQQPEQQPTVRVSTATTHQPPSVEDGDNDGSDSNPSDAENKLIDMYAALTSTVYLASIASTMSLLDPPPRTKIYPQQLTTHDNADIGEKVPRKKVLPIRPLPTNFATVFSGVKDSPPVKTAAEIAAEQRQQQEASRLDAPSIYSQTSLSGTQHGSRGNDSYESPVFPHHEAYMTPNAANRAKRYQNLLSPHPLQQESNEASRVGHTSPQIEEEPEEISNSDGEGTLIPETPALPRRSSKRPLFAARWNQLQEELEQIRPTPSCSNNSVSSLTPSQRTRNHPGSRISSITSMSAKSDKEDRVRSTYTIREEGVEPDWYAGKSDADLRRSSTTRDVSNSNLGSSTGRQYGGISSEDSEKTRWSDMYRGRSGDAKQ